MIRVILIIALSFVAANCGQKGPLEPQAAATVEFEPDVPDSHR